MPMLKMSEIPSLAIDWRSVLQCGFNLWMQHTEHGVNSHSYLCKLSLARASHLLVIASP